ncbi:MAG: NAD-dependent epimerase/dehydratase family protein [Anaerolineae bacterium]|nr:NAD-dependent epimerase/dehydratase family protein [Anaerolineae bacterium]
MKILISGAAGFIGSNLAERLVHEGHEVIGIDNFSDYYDRRQKEHNAASITRAGCQFHEADLVTADLEPVVEGVQVVFHAAAQPGISDKVAFATYVRNNLEATHRLLEACKGMSSLELFVNVATSSVYGYRATEPETSAPEPVSYYGVTKLAAEQLALAYQRDRGFPACSLRLFSVYGERERPDKLYPKLIRSILHDEAFPLFENSMDHSRSFTYVGDVVAAFMAVLNRPEVCIGEIFNIGSDAEMKTREAIETVEALMGKKAKFNILPSRAGDQTRTHANIDKARRMLGFEPQTAFRDGIRNEIDWLTELEQSRA